ncbi:hypothetical protein BC332_03389 [Capsicum chinense]|nr:hypothetical protein BC332_03389 [Capsicum chinense]
MLNHFPFAFLFVVLLFVCRLTVVSLISVVIALHLWFIHYRTKRVFGISVSLIIINMAAVMERADENLLPAVYKEVSETFKAGPSDLSYLTFIRNFIQGIASPVAPGDCITMGASKYFMQVGFWRAVNGFGLAIVIPALQSFIADSYMDESRGTDFGFLSLVGTVGGIGGGAIATVVACNKFWEIPGWRFAFVMMATFSIFIASLVFTFVVDPRKRGSAEHDITKIVLTGFDRNSAAALGVSCVPNLVLLWASHFHGSFFVLSLSLSSYYAFAVTLFLKGMTISWNSTASNGPMFAEVIPSKHRTMIYAFDRAFEVSFSSFAARVVGIVAENLYGYDTKSVDPVLGSAKEALALSKGLFSMMVLPFGLCCLFYTPLYWTFKKDRENARLASIKEIEMISNT